MLRGEWDENNKLNIEHDSDMWCQLFSEIVGGGRGVIWFRGEPKESIQYKNCKIIISKYFPIYDNVDVVFARGGHPYYLPALKNYKDAIKLYYGAGRRYCPDTQIKYDICLVDSEKQKQSVLSVLPDQNVKKYIKPAAKHFKYMPEVKKEYDVCFIANEQQKAFKGIEWVYETAPKDLKILHLGYHDTLNPPDNITCKRVDRIDMAVEINRCKVGIVPYDSVDSAPRALVEMLACGVDVICMDTVNFWKDKYFCDTPTTHGMLSNKGTFWETVLNSLKCDCMSHVGIAISSYYQGNLSIKESSNHLHNLIKECSK